MSDRRTAILLVEDNPGDVRLLQEALNTMDADFFELDQAGRLDEAIEQLAVQHFDVVLLDLALPDANGLDAVTEMRDRDATLPIVVLTGLDDNELAVEAIRAGAQDYLVKGQITGPLLTRSLRYAIERKQVQEALKLSEARFRNLIEQSPIGTAVFHPDGRPAYVNPAQRELMGVNADDLEFLLVNYNILGDKQLIENGLMPFIVKGFAGEAVALPPVLYEPRKMDVGKVIDRDPLWLRAHVFAIRDGHEQIVEIVLTYEDVTEQKKAEEDREKLEVQVQHVQKLKSLGVLAGGIAHDFNNILMAILGNAGLALAGLSPVSPARTNLIEIEKASRRAADLCKQMLAYSGKGRFVVEAINLSEVVQEMAHMLQVSISKKVVLHYDFADNLPAVKADATQMRQIIMNLITNASEAIGEKSGVITIRTGAMHCDREYLGASYLDDDLAEGVYSYVEVSDTGCGMDAETQSKLFDPFFTTKFTGRGLGLSAVLGIIRGHHGAIKVHSEVGQGATFKTLFPGMEERDTMRPSDREDDGAILQQNSGTILLVDDDESVRTVGKGMLERHGFGVLTAAHGGEAVSVFREHTADVDCIVLDLTMPEMDGEEAFRELRRINKDVPVIMSSGYNAEEVTRRFLGKGIAGFIQKPYRSEELVAMIREFLFAPGSS